MKGLIFIVAFTLALMLLPVSARSETDWWNVSWGNRYQIWLNNSDTIDYPNWTVWFDVAGTLCENSDSLRIVYDNTTVIPFEWENSTKKKLYFIVNNTLVSAGENNSDYFLYCNNSGASDISDTIFTFRDNFETDTGNWAEWIWGICSRGQTGQVHSGTWSINATADQQCSYMNQSADGSARGAGKSSFFFYDDASDTSVTGGPFQSRDKDTSHMVGIDIRTSNNALNYSLHMYDGSSETWSNSTVARTTGWHKGEGITNASGTEFYVDDQLIGYDTTHDATENERLIIYFYGINGYVDDFFFDDDIYYEIYVNGVDTGLGELESLYGGNPPQPEITTPTNTTYWTANNQAFTFKTIDYDGSQFNISALLDGSVIYSNSSYYNNTDITVYENVSGGYHNFTVMANDSGEVNYTSVFFTTAEFQVLTPVYDSTSYETDDKNFSVTIRYNPDLITSVLSQLTYDSEIEGNNTYQESNATHFVNTNELSIPLQLTNNTNKTFSIKNFIIYSNTTVFGPATSDYNQTVYFAYYISSMATDKDNYIELENVTVTTNIADKVNVSTLTTWVEFNGTNYTSTYQSGSDPEIYQRIVTIPNLSVANYTYAVIPYLNVSFNGDYFVRTGTGKNISGWQINLNNCSDGVATLIFRMFDEENQSAMNGQFEIALEAWYENASRDFAIEYDANHSHYICLYPAWATFYANATIQYYLDDYPDRNYFLTNAELTNTTAEIQLYMLNDSVENTEVITVTVKDSVGNTIDDVVVRYQRYYIGQDKYETVAMTKSDYIGIGSTFLKMTTVWYKYTLLKNGVVLRVIDPSILTTTDLVLTTSPTTITTSIDVTTGISHSCEYDDATQFLVCEVDDPTGTYAHYCLDVDEVGILNLTDYNETCIYTTSGTLMINLSEFEAYNGTAKYTLSVFSGSDEYILESSYVEFYGSSPYGQFGIFLTILIFSTICMMGIRYPELSIILGLAGVIASVALNFITMTMTAIGSIIFVGIILIYRVKKT